MKKIYYGTGKRKTAVARVFISEGKGKITVNKKEIDKFFNNREIYIKSINEPLVVTEQQNKYDIRCFVSGGGITGQADAIKLGVSRALLKENSEMRPILRQKKLLTRDSREVERKKYGQRGARAKFQYSKR